LLKILRDFSGLEVLLITHKEQFSGPIMPLLLYLLIRADIGHILEELAFPNLITELQEKYLHIKRHAWVS